MRQRIQWDENDRLSLTLAMMGFSVRFVTSRTSLSGAQVAYRLRRLQLNGVRQAYRNGQGALAQFMERRGRMVVRSNVERAVVRYKEKG